MDPEFLSISESIQIDFSGSFSRMVFALLTSPSSTDSDTESVGKIQTGSCQFIPRMVFAGPSSLASTNSDTRSGGKEGKLVLKLGRISNQLRGKAMRALSADPGLVSRTVYRIHNESESIVRLIPKSYIDGAAASSAMVRKELVREIQPKKFIDVDSRKYDLNGKNPNMQIMIHFVAADVPTKDGEVHLKQHDNAAYPKGAEVATNELVFLLHELKNKREIRLTCGKGGKVVEVNDKFLTEESTKPVHQNKK